MAAPVAWLPSRHLAPMQVGLVEFGHGLVEFGHGLVEFGHGLALPVGVPCWWAAARAGRHRWTATAPPPDDGPMTSLTVDAAVIGAGPNGLVAACLLADAGWDVVVVEAEPQVGGAVRSAQLATGHVHDLFSSFYPLAAASPVLDRLDLDAHGLRWRRSPAVLVHLTEPATPAAVLHTDPLDTAAGLEAEHPGDGDVWLRLVEHWNRVRGPLLDALVTPLPAARPMARLVAELGAGALWTARLATLPAHRLGEELFGGRGGRLLLAGNAAHADVPTVGALSGAFGWLLAMLGQDVGFPVPEGGAGQLAAALASRARAAGARIVTGARAERVVVRAGRALGVVCADGTAVRASRAVLATCAAPTLYRELLAPGDVPAGLLAALRRFEWDTPSIKANWSLRAPVPWRARTARTAGTVHLGADADQLAEWSTALAVGRAPAHTFALVGQPAVADTTRAPDGGESLWAYSHLPRGDGTREQAGHLVERIEQLLESYAPGFLDLIVHRFVQHPADLQDRDGNLVAGAINGGTAQPHQQLLLRPVPGTGRPETCVERLYLAGASAHPGGGVHGAAGAQAARAALAGSRLGGVPGRLLTEVQRRLARPAPWDPPS